MKKLLIAAFATVLMSGTALAGGLEQPFLAPSVQMVNHQRRNDRWRKAQLLCFIEEHFDTALDLSDGIGAQAVAVVPIAHIGACSGLRLDEAGLAQLPVHGRDRHVRNAGPVRQLPHRGQPLPGGQFAKGDAEFDQPAQLDAKRHRKGAVQRIGEIDQDALLGRLFCVNITAASISVSGWLRFRHCLVDFSKQSDLPF